MTITLALAWPILLALYLILMGLSHLGVGFKYMNVVLALLAFGTAILLILQR